LKHGLVRISKNYFLAIIWLIFGRIFWRTRFILNIFNIHVPLNRVFGFFKNTECKKKFTFWSLKCRELCFLAFCSELLLGLNFTIYLLCFEFYWCFNILKQNSLLIFNVYMTPTKNTIKIKLSHKSFLFMFYKPFYFQRSEAFVILIGVIIFCWLISKELLELYSIHLKHVSCFFSAFGLNLIFMLLRKNFGGGHAHSFMFLILFYILFYDVF
jgi:hypothetical protein